MNNVKGIRIAVYVLGFTALVCMIVYAIVMEDTEPVPTNTAEDVFFWLFFVGFIAYLVCMGVYIGKLRSQLRKSQMPPQQQFGQPQLYPQPNACKNCRTPLKPDDRFCPHCGCDNIRTDSPTS